MRCSMQTLTSSPSLPPPPSTRPPLVQGYDRSMSGFYAGRLAMIEDAEEHDDDLAVDVRQYSMPPTSSQMGLSVLSPTRKQASGLSTDDLAILQSLGDQIGSGACLRCGAERSTPGAWRLGVSLAVPGAPVPPSRRVFRGSTPLSHRLSPFLSVGCARLQLALPRS